MMADTKIEYSDKVLEVTGGCIKCAPGCQNCWAIKEVWRMAHNPLLGDKWQGLVKKTSSGLNWTGKIKCFEDALEIPLRRKKPTRYFIDSKADLFHESVAWEFRHKIIKTIIHTLQHTYLVLTKRVNTMRNFFNQLYLEQHNPQPVIPNLHLGVSISNQAEMWKAKVLADIPAAVKFISFEPLLADVGKIPLEEINGVIVGGESGPGAREMHPDWVRNIRDQCVAAGVKFYFKQWGEWGIAEPIPNDQQKRFRVIGGSEPLSPNTIFKIFPEHANSTIPLTGWVKVGKKKASRMLDGKEWKQLPERK